MITILLLILTIFIPSFYISNKYKIKIEKIIPCTIFSIILIIYIFGLINLLKIGVYAVYCVSFSCLFLQIIEFIKGNIKIKDLVKIIFKPSICIWFMGIIILYFYYRGRMLIAWDEFSHWGDVVKMMYYNNIYNTNVASLSAARAYPPIMSIFQYFVENLSVKGYQEQYLFCAYQTFVISLIIPFIRNIKWREIYRIILILMIIIIAPTVFFSTPYFYYNIIYIDPFLGILFGYVMACIFITKEYSRFEIISISLALFALTLTKDIAPVFSLIALTFIFLNIVIADKNYKFLKPFNKNNIMKFFKKTKPIWIFLIVIIVSYLSWKINVILNVKDASGSNPSTIKDVIKALLHYGGTYRVTVVDNYIKTLSSYRFTDMGNIYIISFVMIMFSILLYKCINKSEKGRCIFGFYTIYIGEAFYVLLMLVLYILIFSEYEALNVASFDRYIGIYLTALLFFIVFITIYQSISKKKYLNLIILLFLIILNADMTKNLSNFYHYKKNVRITQEIREKYINAANYIRSKIDAHKKYKFYIIVQHSTGAEKWMLRYEIRDVLKEINEGFNWSLGEKYNEGDIWTLDISKDEFKEILFKEDYDYVYLFNIDDKFINRYGSIFNYSDIESGQLYMVNKENRTIEIVK